MPLGLSRSNDWRQRRFLDLSFPRFDRSADLVTWRGDWAVLMVGVAARQMESETAEVQARLDAGPFAPVDGTFNRAVAEAITLWKEE